MTVFVTGGAGFIGSHLVDELVRQGENVIVYDNFSTGFRRHLESSMESGRLRIVEGDILDLPTLTVAMEEASTVFHLAANADVRGGITDRYVDVQQNIMGTHRVLEAMKAAGVSQLVFTSSATVYGEPDRFPTPEDQPLVQTSMYGASKLAAEAMIQAYGEYFSIRSYCFRFVSWIGERYSHGVIYDFVNKLRTNRRELEILGDGSQQKSYLHVSDGVRGVFLALERIKDLKNILNLGHVECVSVSEVARIVCEEMGLSDLHFRFTGGQRGWLGDSPLVQLDISRMQRVGFQPRISIEQGIRRTTRYLLQNQWLLDSHRRR